ncbi:SufE family protein [Wenzhouxiangella limi]|uniref:SufE family protein n=1 Tax=Wenzhouxiangella limi TaxID=2707351 RepID=A0A845VHH1_9GAMM|nr:SufE family protein [Wenzhouxiangella limi]NDY96639.1 SufE family protein [Wenzhouxiangella limi]
MSTATAQQAQQEIIEEFGFFEDWMERYQYLIDLGKKLPPVPPEQRTDDRLLAGCQSNVWFIPEGDAQRLEFRACSDAAIVSGLIALLLRVYSGRSAEEILATEPEFIEAIGLSEHLSATRANGLAAMLQAVRNTAASARS